VIAVRVDDLAFFRGEAIVRPANEDLGATTSLLRRLEIAAGPRLVEQLRIQEPLPIGAAVVTAAGDLPVELLVHGVVMSRTERVTRDGVRRAFTSAMQRALDWQMKDIAVAPFGLGAGNLDIEESATVMSDVLSQHVRDPRFPSSIALIAETDDEARTLRDALDRKGL
jgi:O-acetyl-ADP-ribose deacetylase (regulator of RNase III)